jgi:RimK family alpha-L-glutamate ligase
MDRKKIKEKIKNCKIIYNNTAEDFGIEIAKTIEIMGKRVIDSPESYYFSEDKWLFFLKCKENNIPTPETILLSENVGIAKKELKEFGKWPVILKRVSGTMGEYVEMIKSVNEVEKIIKKFWKKGREKLPIIAQEFIESPSYRVTLVGGKIVQTALKRNKSSWKSTGVYAKKFDKFKVDLKLKKIIKKVVKFSKINICGIDFLKKGNQWFVLEINSEPGLDFFENERKKLLGEILNFLKRTAEYH